MKNFKTSAVLVVAFAVLLGLSTEMFAQSKSRKSETGSSMSHKEKTSRAFINGYNVPSSGVAIDGYCPVCYISANKAVKGKESITHDHDGVTYWFVSEEARQMFADNPQKYLPAYGGWCATGVSVGQRFPVDPTSFKVVNGKLMLFLRNEKVDALKMWNNDEAEMLKNANMKWKKLKG